MNFLNKIRSFEATLKSSKAFQTIKLQSNTNRSYCVLYKKVTQILESNIADENKISDVLRCIIEQRLFKFTEELISLSLMKKVAICSEVLNFSNSTKSFALYSLYHNLLLKQSEPALGFFLSLLCTYKSVYYEKMFMQYVENKSQYDYLFKPITSDLSVVKRILWAKFHICYHPHKVAPFFKEMLDSDCHLLDIIKTFIAVLRTPGLHISECSIIFDDFIKINIDEIQCNDEISTRWIVSILEVYSDIFDNDALPLAISVLVTCLRFTVKDRDENHFFYQTGLTKPNYIYPEALLHMTQRLHNRASGVSGILAKKVWSKIMESSPFLPLDDGYRSKFCNINDVNNQYDRFYVTGTDKMTLRK